MKNSSENEVTDSRQFISGILNTPVPLPKGDFLGVAAILAGTVGWLGMAVYFLTAID